MFQYLLRCGKYFQHETIYDSKTSDNLHGKTISFNIYVREIIDNYIFNLKKYLFAYFVFVLNNYTW